MFFPGCTNRWTPYFFRAHLLTSFCTPIINLRSTKVNPQFFSTAYFYPYSPVGGRLSYSKRERISAFPFYLGFGRRGVPLHLSGFPCRYQQGVAATKLTTSNPYETKITMQREQLGRRTLLLRLSGFPLVSTSGVWTVRNPPPQAFPLLLYLYYTIAIRACKESFCF